MSPYMLDLCRRALGWRMSNDQQAPLWRDYRATGGAWLRDRLFRANMFLTAGIVRSRFNRSVMAGHGDELLQAGWEATARCLDRYRISKGKPVGYFSHVAWVDIMREAKRLRAVVRVDVLNGNSSREAARIAYLDEFHGASKRDDGGASDHRDAIGYVEQADPDTSAWLLDWLPEREAECVRRVVIGEEPGPAVAESFGVTRQAISLWSLRGLRILREAIEDEAA